MVRTHAALISLFAALLLAGPAAAQSFVYPQQGQSPEQQATDEGECHVWAISNSAYDPTAVSAIPPPSQERWWSLLISRTLGAAWPFRLPVARASPYRPHRP